MEQSILNWVFGGIGTIMMFLLNTIWEAIKNLQSSDKEISEKISGIEVSVANEYVKKDEFRGMINAMFIKLDRIEDKVDRKADKSS